MRTHQIKRIFESFYTELGFYALPRASMLHPAIPMSFVMSAGLVQIETLLANAKQRPGNQFVLIQQCFRAFDRERVGTDISHLSLFEMPGAFRFGHTDKTTMVRYMWTLVRDVLGVDPSRIWVSYFGGGTVAGQELAPDDETQRAWLALNVPRERVIGLGVQDNFWTQGGGIEGVERIRKCGPNTELFFEMARRAPCSAQCRPGCKCGRFVEFANSLFITQELDVTQETLKPLREPFSETVIGTERVAMILQRAPSVFEIDSYAPLIATIRRFANATQLAAAERQTSERVIADHLKALVVLVADGAPPPGKNGRARIIKLLIREVLLRQLMLEIRAPHFINTVTRSIGSTVGLNEIETTATAEHLGSYFKNETLRFSKTLARGKKHLEQLLRERRSETLSGYEIVALEKEWGLPHHLTGAILAEHGLSFQQSAYTQALQEWRRAVSN